MLPVNSGAIVQNIRETPIRQRAVIERDGFRLDGAPAWARKGEARRDRRADRMMPTADANLDAEAGNVLCITGRSPSGRKFRIRFVPKESESEPIARRA